MELFVIKRPKRFQRLINNVKLMYYRTKLRCIELRRGLKMLLKSEVLCYYSYNNKKVYLINGLEYVKCISADFGETAFFKINGTIHYCEYFGP